MRYADRDPLRAVILDLDDTLYPEHEFLTGGYRAVAEFLAARTGLTDQGLFDELMAHYRVHGRKGAFDGVLDKHGLASPILVAAALHAYRTHGPHLSPFPDVAPFLNRVAAAGLKSAILTDGKSCVQRAKLKALELEGRVDFVLCTDDLDPGCAKPSPMPFQIVLERFKITPGEAVYVADDESKDFLAPNRLGMDSVRISRRLPHPLAVAGAYPATHRARAEAADLDQVWRMLQQ